VDTNILVYRCDPRDPAKRDAARAVLRRGELAGDLRIAHQSLVEFVNTAIRSRGGQPPLMTREDATRQAELFISEFPDDLSERARFPHCAVGHGCLSAPLV
jgi:predicted nucleic acid-binding protein